MILIQSKNLDEQMPKKVRRRRKKEDMIRKKEKREEGRYYIDTVPKRYCIVSQKTKTGPTEDIISFWILRRIFWIAIQEDGIGDLFWLVGRLYVITY